MGSLQPLWTTYSFLTSDVNVHSFNLRPLPLGLLLHALVKCPSPALLKVFFRYWKVLQILPKAFFSLDWAAPILSAHLHQRDVPALWFSSGLVPTGPHLSFAGHPRLGHSTPGGVSEDQSKGGQSSPLTCWEHHFWHCPGWSWLS